jgi:5-methylcytosine-specific restriction endonuclease McrA
MCVKFCLECNKLLERRINERPANFSRRLFCSIKCSNASRTVIKECPRCGNNKSGKAKYCKECNNHLKENSILNRTLKEVKSLGRNRFGQIRRHAVNVMNKTGIPKKCNICGFDYYVEVCHIKPISSFSPDALIEDINSLNNLVYLCPNHHIMLDKKLIYLDH